MALTQDAYQQLKALIVGCELLPGTPLTENHIVATLGIGKTPVREAMRHLVQDGLLDVTPRSGYTVRPITPIDVEEVFQLRAIVETAAVELAAGRGIDAGTLARLETLCEIGYDATDRASTLEFLALNAEFHATIAGCGGNRRLTDLVTRSLDDTQRCVHLGILRRPRSHEAKREHTALLDALRARNAAEARAQVAIQIENTRRMVLESLGDEPPRR